MSTDAEHLTRSPAETRELARRWGAGLAPGDVVLLEGELGAGKTVVTVACDTGLKYLAGDLYAE